jgi:glutamate-ammonia-ligase adenylyltransferase
LNSEVPNADGLKHGDPLKSEALQSEVPDAEQATAGPGRLNAAEPTDVRSSGRLARMGFTDPAVVSAALAADEVRVWDPVRAAPVDDASAAIVSSLARAADPDLAALALARLLETESGPQLLAELRSASAFRTRLLNLLGSSIALGEHLAAHPRDAFALAGPAGTLATPQDSGREILRIVGVPDSDRDGTVGLPATSIGPDAVGAIRYAYRRGLTVVAAQDLAGELELEEVSAALADLAGYVLRAGLAVARAGLPPTAAGCRLAIIAMGKTGGRELNYVSDVDVVFVAESLAGDPVADDRPVPPSSGAAEQAALATATRLAGETMRICGEAAWEVDAALRPEGKSGVLVRTLASHQAYYRRWASTWEFQALLKARPVAGDLELGQAYVELLSPLIWTAAERPDFVADVQAMRRRVVEHLPASVAPREIKLGPGGLRDVEFAVQLLQLVHGRADDALHAQSTLDALSALSDGGYVGRDDAHSLADAYRFLRSAEHRLQLVKLRRTHLVPEPGANLLRLARSMGFRADRRGGPVAVWDAEWALHVREVRRLHEKLFYRPLLEAVARVPSQALRLTPDEARRRLEALGYADPAGALRHLQALTAGVSRRAAIQQALLPVILSELAEAPDPDGGLLAYRQVSDSLGSTPWFLRLLRDEGAVATRLSRILGTSRYAAALLGRAPETLQLLADNDQLVPRRAVELELTMEITARRQDDYVEAAAAIRRLRRAELLRIAFAQLTDRLDDSATRVALTELADATLSATLAVAQRTVAAEARLDVLPIRFAVIAMGRLGGQELGYASDADVMFVYTERSDSVDEERAAQLAHAVAARLRTMLERPGPDLPLVIDANLRPEGRNGPLVRSLASYAEYYTRWSSVWEAQALLRARYCAGDPRLGEEFVDMIEAFRYPEHGLPAAQVAEIRRIKGRVDAERLPRGADPLTHTKLGRGGLADIEWTAQLLQLRYAHEVPGLRTTATLPAIWSAAEAGKLTFDQAAALEAAWRLASRVRDAIMLVRNKPDDQLPTQGRLLSAVGQVLGYQPGFDPGQLVDDYRRATRRARRVAETVFYDSAD